MTNEFKVDQLAVKIFPDRESMGNEASEMVYYRIVDLLRQKKYVNIIFAAAPSQNEFLSALIKRKDIAWNHVNAFHMDEYIGLPSDAPQRFGSFLKEMLFDHLPFHTVNYINGNATDTEAECKRYSSLLAKYPPNIVCMG